MSKDIFSQNIMQGEFQIFQKMCGGLPSIFQTTISDYEFSHSPAKFLKYRRDNMLLRDVLERSIQLKGFKYKLSKSLAQSMCWHLLLHCVFSLAFRFKVDPPIVFISIY